MKIQQKANVITISRAYWVKSHKGLHTLGHNIVFERFTKKSNIFEKKMNDGKFCEPIAIYSYEKHFKPNSYVA